MAAEPMTAGSTGRLATSGAVSGATIAAARSPGSAVGAGDATIAATGVSASGTVSVAPIMGSPASAVGIASKSSSDRAGATGASNSRSSGGAASPAAATSFTDRPKCGTTSPPGLLGVSRTGPSIARTTGMPVMSRTRSLYPQTPTPATSASDTSAPAYCISTPVLATRWPITGPCGACISRIAMSASLLFGLAPRAGRVPDRACALAHLVHRLDAKNTKTRRNDNGHGGNQRDFRLCRGRIAVLQEAQRRIIIAPVPQGMEI